MYNFIGFSTYAYLLNMSVMLCARYMFLALVSDGAEKNPGVPH